MTPSHEETADALDGVDDLRPPRVPQQARSRAKHDRLLEAAFALFSAHGYEGATIDGIAAQAGVSVGVFYSYFRSKRQILLTLVQQHSEQGISVLTNTNTSIAPTKIATKLWTFLRMARENVGFRRAQQELALSDPAFAAFGRRQRDGLRATLRAELERGRAVGVLRADLECGGTAVAIFALAVQLRDQLVGLPDEECAPAITAAAQMIYHTLVPDMPPSIALPAATTTISPPR